MHIRNTFLQLKKTPLCGINCIHVGQWTFSRWTFDTCCREDTKYRFTWLYDVVTRFTLHVFWYSKREQGRTLIVILPSHIDGKGENIHREISDTLVFLKKKLCSFLCEAAYYWAICSTQTTNLSPVIILECNVFEILIQESCLSHNVRLLKHL